MTQNFYFSVRQRYIVRVQKTVSLETEYVLEIEKLAARRGKKFVDVLNEVVRLGLEAIKKQEG